MTKSHLAVRFSTVVWNSVFLGFSELPVCRVFLFCFCFFKAQIPQKMGFTMEMLQQSLQLCELSSCCIRIGRPPLNSFITAD